MPSINQDTPVEEVAALVSQALEAAGIEATLSGGDAVPIYSASAYQRKMWTSYLGRPATLFQVRTALFIQEQPRP